ncbi:hypothetical protein J2X45_003916 [Caulobacter sp. BE264]|uniref:hypothetical protein n=1 Tax=Caulobacter sp. BE264 TaxID=2817724 RepID=UPI00285E3491|nr:hypothetical protein [Caulobacter sp. BE264]MDR7232806.1 hypothetical protein [Caulobacter sp. BE264]
MIDAAIRRGLSAAEHIETDRARLRSAMEAVFVLAGLAGLDVILAAERQSLAERFSARMNTEGFVK